LDFSGGETTLTNKGYNVLYGGRQRQLDQHLRKGGGRDPRYVMRVYFFWDDDQQMAVVGWLPGHLDNTLT
jgi:hypothetical protein